MQTAPFVQESDLRPEELKEIRALHDFRGVPFTTAESAIYKLRAEFPGVESAPAMLVRYARDAYEEGNPIPSLLKDVKTVKDIFPELAPELQAKVFSHALADEYSVSSRSALQGLNSVARHIEAAGGVENLVFVEGQMRSQGRNAFDRMLMRVFPDDDSPYRPGEGL